MSSSNVNNNIEDLLRQLHGQIKSSDWLKSNTAEKFEQENPEIAEAWKNAIAQDTPQQDGNKKTENSK